MKPDRRDPVATASGRARKAPPARCRSPVPVRVWRAAGPLRRAIARTLVSGALLGPLLPAPAMAGDFAELAPVAAAPAPALAASPQVPDALAALKGRPVVINFWATWCEPCRAEMPALDALRARRPDIAVLTVAVADSAANVRRFAEDYLLDLEVVLDPDQARSRSWGVRMLPTTVVLDADHRIRYRAAGPLDWHAPRLDTLLTGLAPRSARD